MRFAAPLAVLQMAMPAPSHASVIMVASCGGAGTPVPLRIPDKDDGSKSLPCCKICHISMRKRATADSCCENTGEGEDESDGC
ncbi:hypothetical protein IQ25_00330 [Novosphingobium taihuense]|nr:hypothetical protein IQ25_00330 [Novosphingobium taihuense]